MTHGFPNLHSTILRMHIGTCVNLVRFLSHYFQFLKILVPHSLLSLMGSRVLIGVGNKGRGREWGGLPYSLVTDIG